MFQTLKTSVHFQNTNYLRDLCPCIDSPHNYLTLQKGHKGIVNPIYELSRSIQIFGF